MKERVKEMTKRTYKRVYGRIKTHEQFRYYMSEIERACQEENLDMIEVIDCRINDYIKEYADLSEMYYRKYNAIYISLSNDYFDLVEKCKKKYKILQKGELFEKSKAEGSDLS